jgi:hypothetical protein
MRKTGVVLLCLTFLLLLYTSLAAPAYAHAHTQLDPALVAQYAAPWPVALASSLALLGLSLTLIPIRRGERWASWVLLAVLHILLVTRLSTDPRCLVVLDPHQHGCHTFMIAVLLGLIGLALAAFGRPANPAAD